MHTGEPEYVHTGELEYEPTVEGQRSAARGARAGSQPTRQVPMRRGSPRPEGHDDVERTCQPEEFYSIPEQDDGPQKLMIKSRMVTTGITHIPECMMTHLQLKQPRLDERWPCEL